LISNLEKNSRLPGLGEGSGIIHELKSKSAKNRREIEKETEENFGNFF